jgi:hypothetical protein
MNDRVRKGFENKDVDWRYGGGIGWIPFAFHLIPRRALAKVAGVFRSGELAGRESEGWKCAPVPEHLNHAMSHIVAYLEGYRGDRHLANAACRILIALELDEVEDVRLPAFLPGPEVPPEVPGGSGEGLGGPGDPVPGSLGVPGRVETGGPVRRTGERRRAEEAKAKRIVEAEAKKAREGAFTSDELALGLRHGGSRMGGTGGDCLNPAPGPGTLEKVKHYEEKEECREPRVGLEQGKDAKSDGDPGQASKD